MNGLKLFLCFFLCLSFFTACNDDDAQDGNYINGNKMRVKRIVGENAQWGKYELEFSYRADGRLDKVWRINPEVTEYRDTVGGFFVEYDVDYHDFRIMDYLLRIDQDSVKKLQEEYPGSYQDTLSDRRTSVIYYSTKLEEGKFIAHKYRKKRSNGSGINYNPSYINVSAQTDMLEVNENGEPLVVRCYKDIYGTGGKNGQYDREVTKYEFSYEGNEIVAGGLYMPDSFNDDSWTKLKEITFTYFSGVMTGVDSEFYKMRRSSNKVVIAEPGINTTYMLNSEGFAIEMENTKGEHATIEYEEGAGNFAELYSTPLERALGKIWVK